MSVESTILPPCRGFKKIAHALTNRGWRQRLIKHQRILLAQASVGGVILTTWVLWQHDWRSASPQPQPPASSGSLASASMTTRFPLLESSAGQDSTTGLEPYEFSAGSSHSIT
ncbi:hypothetical protein PoB_006855600 [Plakobranchus ocellatus]|uniref:HIG1 domain-containing protein n=1 Tax=Plakobranchus ocellatus TaxID=259542 RepID=A0AAV4DD85_9GAST|nr:hypothetical protein PoB_006855600 [Plakobranchus ocellatus]